MYNDYGASNTKKVKVAPGRTQSLQGFRFVITGETVQVPRSELESRLRSLGAQVSSAVSGLTNFLVKAEKLEDGRPAEEGTKYKKAQQLISEKKNSNLAILSEEELFQRFPLLDDSALTDEDLKATEGLLKPNFPDQVLWTEKYRPQYPYEFVDRASIFKQIQEWLVNWQPSNQVKAVLLAGPPGLGKTALAHATAKSAGLQLIEFNASDIRNVAALSTLDDLVKNRCSILTNKQQPERVVILMDEADGVTGKGGTMLLDFVKITAQPFILTCNNLTIPRMQTLAKNCLTFQLNPCSTAAALARAAAICRSEGIEFDPKVLQRCYECSNGDMRYFISLCQYTLLCGDQDDLSTKDFSTYDNTSTLTKNLFLRCKTSTTEDKMNTFFADYSAIPLFVEENALKQLEKCVTVKSPTIFAIAAKMYAYFSAASQINSVIREQSRWDLLPAYGMNAIVYPLNILPSSSYTMISFPKQLIKASTRKKQNKNLVQLMLALRVGNPDSLIFSGKHELINELLVNTFDQMPADQAAAEIADWAQRHQIPNKNDFVTTMFDTKIDNEPSLFDLLPAKAKLHVTKAFSALEATSHVGKRAVKLTNSSKSTDLNSSVEHSEVDEEEDEKYL